MLLHQCVELMCLWLILWGKANAENVFRNVFTDTAVTVSYTFKSPLQTQLLEVIGRAEGEMGVFCPSWTWGKNTHHISSSSCLSSSVWCTTGTALWVYTMTVGRWGHTEQDCREVVSQECRGMLQKELRVNQLNVHAKRESVHSLERI